MVELEQVGGLWVPAREVHRFRRCPVYDGLPDLDVSKVLKAATRSTSHNLAVDIGAHIGATAVALSRVFQRVIAFEAVPEIYAVLKRNAEGRPNIECLDVAIGKVEGTLSFEFLAKHSQLSHVLRDGERPYFKGSTVVSPIRCLPLDRLGYTDVSLIKIDVEGTELDVLEGAQETILRCRPLVLVEQGGNETKFHGAARNEGAAFLEGLGMVRLLPFPYNDDWLYGFQ